MKLQIVEIKGTLVSVGSKVFANTAWLTYKRALNPLVIENNIIFDRYTCTGSVEIPEAVSIAADGIFDGNEKITELVLNKKHNTLHIEVNNSDDAEMILKIFLSSDGSRKTMLNDLQNEKQKIQLAIFLVQNYESETATNYLINNIESVMDYMITNNEKGLIEHLLTPDYITNSNIDSFIQLAIDSQKIEIQTMLTEYKNEKIGFKSVFDRFKL